MRYFLASIILVTTQLSAYQPGKWSPMDVYVIKGEKSGPTGLIAKDPTGKVLERAEFSYDTNGRLIGERFFDSSGKPLGSNDYKRTNGLLSEEVRKDGTGKVLSRSVYNFSKDPKEPVLNSVMIYNAKGQPELERKYSVSNGMIVGGEEIVAKNSDRFVLKYTENKLPEALLFIQPDGHPFGQIVYRYDDKKRLTERERTQSERRELCRYTYDASGRMISYSYFYFDDGWKPEKSLYFTYP